jgi:type IV pilus assembly protein PilA
MDSLRQRLARDEGFTLIELLIVIVIIGILLAIAVPSYLGFRDRANQKAASSDVRAAVPAAEAYFADNGSYNSMDLTSLRAIDTGVDVDTILISTNNTAPRVAGDTYCMQKTVNGKVSSVVRGKGALNNGAVREQACPAVAAL